MSDLWSTFAGMMRAWFWWCIDWLMGHGSNLIEVLIGQLEAALPDTVGLDLAQLKGVLEIANAWAPLDLVFALMGTYVVVAMATYTLRLIIKLIPTVG